jgi:hypothetical protein
MGVIEFQAARVGQRGERWFGERQYGSGKGQPSGMAEKQAA